MKKNIMWACCLFTSLFVASCSGDYEDATSKHQYGENELVYFRADASASAKKSFEFSAGDTEAQTVNLSEYETMFQEQMGMSLTQVIEGIANKSVVMKLINPTKGYWEKGDFTNGTGWFVDESSKACAQADAKATVTLDATTKSLKFALTEGTEAGTALDVNVGFAINGTDYDKYVRIELVASVTDPSILMMTVPMEADDYAGYDIILADYDENFQICMGMSAEEVVKGFFSTPRTVNFYISDLNGNWDTTSSFTADNGDESYGYWANTESKVCNWGETGYSVFANIYQADQDIYVGRAPGIAAGESRKVSFVLAKADDPTQFVRFVLTCEM